jgi:hypothetical protein
MYRDVPWCVPWCTVMSQDVPWCTVMYRDVPWCTVMSHDEGVPGYLEQWCLTPFPSNGTQPLALLEIGHIWYSGRLYNITHRQFNTTNRSRGEGLCQQRPRSLGTYILFLPWYFSTGCSPLITSCVRIQCGKSQLVWPWIWRKGISVFGWAVIYVVQEKNENYDNLEKKSPSPLDIFWSNDLDDSNPTYRYHLIWLISVTLHT